MSSANNFIWASKKGVYYPAFPPQTKLCYTMNSLHIPKAQTKNTGFMLLNVSADQLVYGDISWEGQEYRLWVEFSLLRVRLFLA